MKTDAKVENGVAEMPLEENPGKRLTKLGEKYAAYFERSYGTGNCSCHLGNAPCSSCTHPGNPVNLAEDETLWEDVPEDENKPQPPAEENSKPSPGIILGGEGWFPQIEAVPRTGEMFTELHANMDFVPAQDTRTSTASEQPEMNFCAPDRRTWLERLVAKLWPARHVRISGTRDQIAKFSKGDVINIDVTTTFSAVDMLRLLFSWRVQTSVRVMTEHVPGDLITLACAAPRRPAFLEGRAK